LSTSKLGRRHSAPTGTLVAPNTRHRAAPAHFASDETPAAVRVRGQAAAARAGRVGAGGRIDS